MRKILYLLLVLALAGCTSTPETTPTITPTAVVPTETPIPMPTATPYIQTFPTANPDLLLFSTHILSEAEQVCDNIIIVNHGQIQAEGSPSELRANLERGGRVLLRLNVPPAEALPAIQALPERRRDRLLLS